MMGGLHGGGPWYAKEIAMATPSDYATGTAALLASVDKFIDAQVKLGKIPGMFTNQAKQFVAQMAAQGAKDVIDAVDAGRKGSVVA
jgi:pyruvate/oxaloacetate carboxyltransferase